MMRNYLVLGLMAISSCTGLDSDYGPKGIDDNPITSVPDGVIILNEGNFQAGNASIDVYNKATGNVLRNAFQSANDRPLGDVAQSMLIDADTGYIVVNNSGKIEKVILPTMQSIATLDGFRSPRYMIKIDDHKAYVSDLYAGRITVIDPTYMTVSKEIEAAGWTEKMFLYQNRVFVQSFNNSGMYIIDVHQDQVVGMVSIPELLDVTPINDQELACLTQEGISTLNMNNGKVENVMRISGLNTFSRIDYSPLSQKAYVLTGDLIQYSFITNMMDTLFIAGEKNLYGLKVDRSSGDIFLTDARDFVQNGEVLWLTPEGGIQQIIETGKIPQDVQFHAD